MAAPARSRWKPNKDEQADLDAMNNAVARIQQHTPKDPYFLEIPQENRARYQHHQSQRHQWVRDTPFRSTEKESLQYQTFHLYEQGTEVFEQHSTRLEVDGSSRQGLTRTGTPSTAPKNKISLAAYKKKQNAAMTTPELNAQKVGDAPAKQAAVKGPVERAKAETEEMLAAVAESEQEVPPVAKKQTQAPVNDLKRKREEESKVEAQNEHTEPATKKAKSLPDKPIEKPAVQNAQQRKAGAAATTRDDVVSGTSKTDEQRLPPRLSPQLSPLLPDRLSPLPEAQSPSMELPPRLTPTIPNNIVKTLEAQKDSPPASQSADPAATHVKSKDQESMLTPSRKVADKITKHKSPVPPRNGFRANTGSPAVRAEAEERLPSATSAPPPKGAQPSQVDDVVAKPKKSKTSQSPPPPPVLQKPRLLLKLKYRKSQASAIERILKMRRAPDKRMLAPPPEASTQPAEDTKPAPVEKVSVEPKESASSVKGVAQKVGPAKREKKAEKPAVSEKRPPEKPAISNSENPSTAEKRPVAEKEPATQKRKLPEEDRHDSPAKRKKDDVSTTRKEPSTPASQLLESPSGSKSQLQATPSAKNNLLAVAMARDKSQDSNSTQTPPPGTANTPTISSTSQPNGIARPPSSQPSSKTPRQQAWGVEARQFEKLGKELKHAATAHQNNKLPNSATSMTDKKLAAVKSIESLLCFLLGFVCLDEAGQAAEPRPHQPEIRNWQSLAGFQGFVKRNVEEFPALAGLNASLTVVFAARTLNIAAQYHRDGDSTFSRENIMDTQSMQNKYAAEAEAKLDVDILMASFPKTWSQRTKVLSSREKLEPSKLGGQFKLPINQSTSPVRAARAGCAMLREWLDANELNYSLKLKLGS